MFDDDPVQEVGFGVSTAATVAKGAFRLGQINVTSGTAIELAGSRPVDCFLCLCPLRQYIFRERNLQ